MDRHFIESCEDDREVVSKIEELKALGYAESDMYVIARSSEQLVVIRTRTTVEYHAKEEFQSGRNPPPPLYKIDEDDEDR